MKKIILATIIISLISLNSFATTRDNEVNRMYESAQTFAEIPSIVLINASIHLLMIDAEEVVNYSNFISNNDINDEKKAEKHMIELLSELKSSWLVYIKTKKGYKEDLLKDKPYNEIFLLSLINEYDLLIKQSKQV